MTRIVVLLAALLAAAAAVQGSQATFTASKTNSGTSFVTASNFPPAVTLTAPAAGATTNGRPTVSGAAGSTAQPSACAQNRASRAGSFASIVSCQNTMTGTVCRPADIW
mgnify:CR=1 FL=1